MHKSIEKLSVDNIERYIILSNQLSIEDPYVIKMNKEEFLEESRVKIQNGELTIYVISHNDKDIGFITLNLCEQIYFIDDLYIKKQYADREMYKELLGVINRNLCSNYNTFKYVGVNDNAELMEALATSGFVMEREHIQMEKSLSESYKLDINYEAIPFYKINNPKWVYEFMKECMRGNVFNYSEKEVEELTTKDYDLVLVFFKEKEQIGFITSFINEKRNFQQGKKVIYVEEIAIHKDFRNKGIGQEILKYIIDKGIQSGMDTARLHVYRDNEIAYNLYKKLGFQEIKSIGHWRR